MRTYRHPPEAKTNWTEPSSGPWDDEPDKATWVDPATGLDCMIHRGPMGALCGYVGVTEGHPEFEVSYHEVDVRVHGGLTYSDFCRETDDESYGICHVPEPGRPDKVWWLGFDCGHYNDLIPGMSNYLYPTGEPHYWTFDEVKAEVERLAAQLVAA